MGARDAIAQVIAKGIKAFHSSPHDFDKFSVSKIGTGEGAQVYGHGLYFAENPAVSGQGGQYWNQFAGRFDKGDPVSVHAMNVIGANKGDRAAAIADMERILRDKPSGYNPERITAVRDFLASGKSYGPRTYEVNIAADPARFLDWDKPLAGQSPEVAGALSRMGYFGEGRRASEGYHKYAQDYGGADAAADALLDRGIPGIRYLDEGSRISSPDQIKAIRDNIAHREALLAERPGDPTNTKWLAEYQDMLKRAENPTSNYVIFDPDSPLSKVDILKKYAVPGAIGTGAMGSVFDPSSYTAEEVQR